MMDSSVLLPEPDAPTMATVSPLAPGGNRYHAQNVSVPVESVTDLNTCSTAMMGPTHVVIELGGNDACAACRWP
jgi:hypothetical protein